MITMKTHHLDMKSVAKVQKKTESSKSPHLQYFNTSSQPVENQTTKKVIHSCVL